MLNKTGRRFGFKVIPLFFPPIPRHIFRDSKLKEHFTPPPSFQKNPSSKSTRPRRLSPLSPENFNYSARFRIPPPRIRRLKPANSARVPTKPETSHPWTFPRFFEFELLQLQSGEEREERREKKSGKEEFATVTASSEQSFLLLAPFPLSFLFFPCRRKWIHTHTRVTAGTCRNGRVWTRARTPGEFT